MSEPAVYLNFTYACRTCGETVEVTNGTDTHPCDTDNNPVLTIEGCNASAPLVERVEQSLADYDRLTTTEEPS